MKPGPVAASPSVRNGLALDSDSSAIENQIAQLKKEILDRYRENEQAGVLAEPAPIVERRSAAPTAEEPSPDISAQLAAIEERLAELERNSRILLARRPGATAPRLRVPPGMPVRDFLQALEDMDDDESTRLHELWTGDQLLQAYGQPDRIEERRGYTEWIYTLGPNEQLDFHLTGGLVTLAH